MAIPDLTGSPALPTEAVPSAAYGFVPEVAAIERLANAFLKGLTGGAPPGSPAVPASPPAPWSASPQPSTPTAASVTPIQPPFGQPEPPGNSVPASVPYRSFGGASAGSASPFAFAQSRAVAPAVSQTAIAAPRVDPLQASALLSPQPFRPPTDSVPGAPDGPQAPLSPFAAPIDLSAALAAFSAAVNSGYAPPAGGPTPVALAPASGASDPSAASAAFPAATAIATPGATGTSPADPAPWRAGAQPASRALTPGSAASIPVEPVPWRAGPHAGAVEPELPGHGADSIEPAPFTKPISLGATQRELSPLPIAVPSQIPVAARDGPASPAAPAGREWPAAELANPVAGAALAPSAPISPVFTGARSGPQAFDAASIRNDFPILQEKIHGRRLIWLDNGATTQKPQAVIDRISAFYAHENSNVHRGAHTLAARATDAYEAARDKVRRFVGASSPNEIVFVRGTTEGINLVAQAWGRRNVKAGDEIVITWLEHHANIVPWQQLCLETGARLRVAPVDDNGDILLDAYENLLGPRTRIVALSLVSNALGTVTPAREMITAAHRHGALALVDGAQSVAHKRTDVQALDADFFVLSGHKMFAPTGIGALYGKQSILETTPPWQGGGSMIADVTFEKTVYQSAPARFEAGTGNIADAVGLGAAIDYLDSVGMEAISRHEHELIALAVAGLRDIPGLRLIGAPRERAGVVSFVLDGIRTEDVGKALDREGIAVRAGHHCAQPILRRFGQESSVRPSFALYNTAEDVEALVAAVRRIALQGMGGSR